MLIGQLIVHAVSSLARQSGTMMTSEKFRTTFQELLLSAEPHTALLMPSVHQDSCYCLTI